MFAALLKTSALANTLNGFVSAVVGVQPVGQFELWHTGPRAHLMQVGVEFGPVVLQSTVSAAFCLLYQFMCADKFVYVIAPLLCCSWVFML